MITMRVQWWRLGSSLVRPSLSGARAGSSFQKEYQTLHLRQVRYSSSKTAAIPDFAFAFE